MPVEYVSSSDRNDERIIPINVMTGDKIRTSTSSAPAKAYQGCRDAELVGEVATQVLCEQLNIFQALPRGSLAPLSFTCN